MARASLRAEIHSHGASLQTIARELRAMDDAKVTDLFRKRLLDAAKPVVPRVAAAVMAIPAAGEKHTGLRARIARCAETATWSPEPRTVAVAIVMNPKRMPSGEMGLPLYMEGVRAGRHDRWRHPVFGRREDPWVQQAAHPYFYGPAGLFGRAAGEALRLALEDVTRQISG